MLSVGGKLNGFTIHTIIGEFRAGKPDGAVIVAWREDADGGWETVVARIGQSQIDAERDALHWDNGDYSPGRTDLGPALRTALVAALLRTTNALPREIGDVIATHERGDARS